MAGVPEVTEAAVKNLIEKGGLISKPLSWAIKNGQVRSRMEVDNPDGEALEIDVHISTVLPGKYSLALLWAKRCITRLDVRGSHVNHCDGTQERWRRTTHKHRHSDAYAMAQAYTPGDVPSTPGLVAPDNEYEAVFKAFCAECGIDPDDAWVPPTFEPTPVALHDAEDE